MWYVAERKKHSFQLGSLEQLHEGAGIGNQLCVLWNIPDYIIHSLHKSHYFSTLVAGKSKLTTEISAKPRICAGKGPVL